MPPYLTYQNLDLEIEAYGEGYRAHVINSPVGQVDWTIFHLPFSPQQVQAARTLFGSVRHVRLSTALPPLNAKAFGHQLYEAVFAGEIGRCLSRSLAELNDETGLRIRLRLNNAPDLADLPWEMLYGPAPFDFFALSARTPIVRYLAAPLAEAALTATLPLRILVVIANPATPDAPALDVEAEWAQLHTALAALQEKHQVVLERLASPTLAALHTRLRISADKPAIHLLHFIGHGETNRLVFEDEQGAPALVAADRVAVLLHDHSTLKLAFLNACEGGRSDTHDIFLGVAPELVRSGLPAVIAMKYAVSDRAAIGLAAEFYQALADGYPVDAALAEARKVLYVGGQSVEWGTPLLFSRSADNRLFVPVIQEPDPVLPQMTIQTEGGAAEISRQDFEPEMVLIPAGPFWMGSDDGPAHERPRHHVTLADYQIGKYPVTNAQYAVFVQQATEHRPRGGGWRFTMAPPDKLDQPVTGISWHDAVAYSRWLTKQTRRQYRLPSEAEWEKAAQTGFIRHASREWTTTIWGDEMSLTSFPYPYRADGRESLTVQGVYRIWRRRGDLSLPSDGRGFASPTSRLNDLGFRVVCEA